MALPESLKSRLRLPAVAAPLFIISNPDLVIEQCKAGIVGSFPSLNARPLEELDRWMQRITSELAAYDEANPDAPSAPYAVNLIVHGSNNRLQEDLEMCVKYKAPIVITSLGAKEFVNEAIHSYGGIVLHDIINNRFAKKAVEKGADGLIAVAAGAGGHAGTTSPFALVQEIREWFDGPLLLSGSIASGDAILGAQAMGADLGYIGSAFIATEEANAEEAYKQAIVDYNSSDIIYSNLFTGVHGNYLAPSVEAAGLDPANLPDSDPSAMDFGSGGNTDAKAWKNIWGCGQGIGAVKSIGPTAALVERLRVEYAAARARLLDAA
ncbi:nitronate monooxygenase family protein [Congregibacter variabilis]|uniref:Nitronate monooxygenase family protein n=1 Tax=Congregibacter variabilis TaxID=3081200 RepID=A0ABZ0I2W8_9GAMM|nr:nitronate monooxygenase family protein [Congregibacter sp. IMCC43200]